MYQDIVKLPVNDDSGIKSVWILTKPQLLSEEEILEHEIKKAAEGNWISFELNK